jgi:AbrB family looped-hinge helix DNA binding protein
MEQKMEKTKIEQQGRVFIPKKARETAGIRPGQEVTLTVEKGKITLNVTTPPEHALEDLKGCVKNSKINPLKVKNIWKET